MYDMLSNHTHPTLYTVEHRRRFIPDGEQHRTVLEVQETEVESLVRLTVQLTRLTFSVVCQYGGWPFDREKELERQIDEVMPGLFK
ncbi:hypothetical protein IU474_25995 [Nocardia otitidiscaviarum]|uniref:hypothetical protein n=1 Tax=Nocardia otitidiscaviarum TaxID=1823 RepID=UPI0018935AD4|nr:hypothetical protein [Nocardia otitidiscaviarum]MBF6240501.1 hypothetical protein [Nocardia otitidiscaviarum]